MLKLVTAPVTNDRGPRYMERALAAIHQASQRDELITFIYATVDDRVSLFVRFAGRTEEFVTGPIAANFPNCSLTTVSAFDDAPSDWKTWYADLELTPEIFPILRHAQFEDLLNGTFADPVSGILRAVKPDDAVRCRIEIHVASAGQRRRKRARHAVHLLDREFFRVHYRLAEYYAEHITRRQGWLIAWLLGVLARQSPHQVRTTIDTSASRLHDREEHVQAASDKIGGHLFETHIRLIAQARPDVGQLAVARLQQMAGAFGAFTQSRGRKKGTGPICRNGPEGASH